MFAFFLKILFCLLIAAAIGFLMAWLLRGLALNRLREHNYRLTSDLTGRDNQVAVAQAQIQDLRGKNALFERDLGTVNARIAELQDRIAREQKQNLALADELRIERERVIALEGIASKRTSELEAAQKNWTSLSRDKDSEISRLGAQLTPLLGLPAVLSQRDDEARKLSDDLRLRSEEFNAIQARLDETASAKGKLEGELSTLRASLEQARRDAETELGRRASRIAELERLSAADKTRLVDLEQQIAVAARDLSTTRGELTAARGELTTARSELTAARGEVTAARGELTTTQARLVEINKTKDGEIARLGAQLAPLAALPAALNARDGELNRIKASYEQQLTELRAKFDATQQAIRARDTDLAAVRSQLENEVSALRGRSDNEMSQLKSRVSTLAGDLQSRESTLSTLRVELDAARKTLDSRSALLRDAETAKQVAVDAVKVKDAELARLRAEVSTLNALPARLASLQSDLSVAGNERKNLEWQWQQAQGDLEARLSECAAARRALEAELETLKQSSNLPPRQFASAPAVIDDLKHIFGVGPVLEKMLHGLGVYQFKQVALWSAEDIRFFDQQLHEFHGRIERENWVRSAQEEQYKKYGEWLGQGLPTITMPETNR